MLLFIFFQNEVGRRAGDALNGGQPLAHELGHFAQGAARDNDSQVEGAAHEVHALHLVVLVDAFGNAVKAVLGLGCDVDFDKGGHRLLADPVPVDNGLIAQDCTVILIFFDDGPGFVLRYPRCCGQRRYWHGAVLLQQL